MTWSPRREHLGVVFQPILEVHPTRRVFALECLSRGPQGSSLESADALFSWVRKRRMEMQIDRMCIKNILQEAASLPGKPNLSINLHAQTLGTKTFPDFLSRSAAAQHIDLSRIILEAVEETSSLYSRTLIPNLSALRRLGCRIAIDDFGIGSSNFQRMLEWRPDLLKIGRYFIGGCSDDPRRLDIVENISQTAYRFGIGVVAEGIECKTELALVSSFGINLVQGYLFAVPTKADAMRPA
jgi:EAL domain-containing protein (putative c-di-GMP-specific phosphodiesterase class I)